MEVEPLYKVKGDCIFWFNSNEDYKYKKLEGSTIVDLNGYKDVFLIKGEKIMNLSETMNIKVDEEEVVDVENEQLKSLDTMGIFFKNLLQPTPMVKEEVDLDEERCESNIRMNIKRK